MIFGLISRQHRQRGISRVRARQRYLKNRNKYKLKAKRRYVKLRNNPAFKRRRKLYVHHPNRFKRLANLSIPVLFLGELGEVREAMVERVGSTGNTILVDCETGKRFVATVFAILNNFVFLTKEGLEKMFGLLDTIFEEDETTDAT